MIGRYRESPVETPELLECVTLHFVTLYPMSHSLVTIPCVTVSCVIYSRALLPSVTLQCHTPLCHIPLCHTHLCHTALYHTPQCHSFLLLLCVTFRCVTLPCVIWHDPQCLAYNARCTPRHAMHTVHPGKQYTLYTLTCNVRCTPRPVMHAVHCSLHTAAALIMLTLHRSVNTCNLIETHTPLLWTSRTLAVCNAYPMKFSANIPLRRNIARNTVFPCLC